MYRHRSDKPTLPSNAFLEYASQEWNASLICSPSTQTKDTCITVSWTWHRVCVRDKTWCLWLSRDHRRLPIDMRSLIHRWHDRWSVSCPNCMLNKRLYFKMYKNAYPWCPVLVEENSFVQGVGMHGQEWTHIAKHAWSDGAHFFLRQKIVAIIHMVHFLLSIQWLQKPFQCLTLMRCVKHTANTPGNLA